jgi:DNA invertase Pin-like site-specific DNA recombinase
MSPPVHPLAGQRVGYARISSASRNLDGQTDALTAAGCQKIFADASGKLTERPELTVCLGYLRAGDTLVVWRLDRLGRSLRHLVETVNALAGRGWRSRPRTRGSTPPPALGGWSSIFSPRWLSSSGS